MAGARPTAPRRAPLPARPGWVASAAGPAAGVPSAPPARPGRRQPRPPAARAPETAWRERNAPRNRREGPNGPTRTALQPCLHPATTARQPPGRTLTPEDRYHQRSVSQQRRSRRASCVALPITTQGWGIVMSPRPTELILLHLVPGPLTLRTATSRSSGAGSIDLGSASARRPGASTPRSSSSWSCAPDEWSPLPAPNGRNRRRSHAQPACWAEPGAGHPAHHRTARAGRPCATATGRSSAPSPPREVGGPSLVAAGPMARRLHRAASPSPTPRQLIEGSHVQLTWQTQATPIQPTIDLSEQEEQ